jgi:RNA polymerase sigma-70 factor (ECF subfamily)
VDSSEQTRRFEEWMEAHGAIVHRIVNGFAAGADRADLLQEVLLAVWKAAPAYRGEAKVTTFLYRVSHNAALLWARGERNHRRRIVSAAENAQRAQRAQAAPEPRLAAVYEAIRQLSPVDRSLVLLWLDELAYREIAAVLGLSESNIGVKLNGIKNHLAALLKGTSDDV